MTKRSDRRLQKAVSAAIGTRERKVERIPGFLGTFVDGEETIRVPNRKDFVFVRLRMDQSEVVEAFNDQVGDLFGTPVTVIRDPSAPRFYRVISREIATFQDWGSPYLVNHAEQHMFAGGTGTVASDVVWVYRRAFVPLGVSPNGSMTAEVASDYFAWDQGIKHFGPTGTVDFSAIRDSLGTFEARFITVLLNGDDSELNYVTGEIFDNTLVVDDPTEFIALPDPNVGIPLAAIYLFNSMTEVLWDNIFDIRQIIQGIGGSAGGSGVNWGNVIIVAKSGGDHSTITAALAVATSGDIVLVMPGTYAESITLVAGVTVVGIANSTDPVILAPAAGTAVTIPSGAGTYRLHNCTLTPPSSTATVTDTMGAAGLATLYRVSIGTSGGGDSIDSSGGNASATLTLEECRLSGNFAQFSICDFIDCISTSSINPAASAGDLTIYGGEIAAEVDDVSGQTVAFLNTPFIGGAVTDAGTLFGEYVDGNGWDISLGAFVAPVGVVGAPTYKFSGDVDTGFYQPAVDHIGIAIAGVQQGLWGSGELSLPSYDIDLVNGGLLVAGTERINNSGGALFTSIIDSALTSGRVTFATTNGELTDDADFTFDGSQLALAVQGITGGALFGGDALLYRNAANVLRTPDTLIVDVDFGLGTDTPSEKLHMVVEADALRMLGETYNDTNSAASQFKFQKAGGTVASPTTTASGESLGIIRGFGYDGDSFEESSQILIRVASAVSDGIVPGNVRFNVADTAGTLRNMLDIRATGSVFNEGSVDADLRVEGNSLLRLFFVEGNDASENIAMFAGAAPNWQSMDRGLFVGDVSTAPTGDPSAGGFLFSNAGAGTWHGSSGTVTGFGPAGPHCRKCGYDFWRVNYVNKKWGAVLRVCGWCETEYREGPKSVFDKLSIQELSEVY